MAEQLSGKKFFLDSAHFWGNFSGPWHFVPVESATRDRQIDSNINGNGLRHCGASEDWWSESVCYISLRIKRISQLFFTCFHLHHCSLCSNKHLTTWGNPSSITHHGFSYNDTAVNGYHNITAAATIPAWDYTARLWSLPFFYVRL